MNINGGVQILGGAQFLGRNKVDPYTSGLVLQLDAATYSGTGNWIDSVSNRAFVLYNSPTYSASVGGGSFDFSSSGSQYAQCNSSLSSLSTWTAEVWHYYDDTIAGPDGGGLGACIITEVYTGTPQLINFSLGNNMPLMGNPKYLQSGFWNGSWRTTQEGYTLTANNWYHIVGTYDGSTVKLYVNGDLIYSTSYTGSAASSTHGIRLMRRWDNADYWGGKLSIVRVYSGDIGQAGVTQNFAADRERFNI